MAWFSPAPVTNMIDARKHRPWVLVVLAIVYVFNYIDRQVLSILQDDIKADLNLSEFQLSLMTGLSFAAIYCVVGIPVARIADSRGRKGVVAGSLALWSGFTVLCGLATNFWGLLFARLGVGAGEAGGAPPAHAMLSDLYEKEKRGRALALYSCGLYLGTLLGYALGGFLSDVLNWRMAFMVVGAPGVLFAIIVWVTVREPQRGLSGGTDAAPDVTFRQSFAKLWKITAFRHYSLAAGAGLFITYGLGNWMPSFLRRTHHAWSMPEVQHALGFCRSVVTNGVNDCVDMSQTEVGVIFGIAAGVGGAVGTLLGGYLADGKGEADRRWFLWVPMWGKIIGGPLFVAAMLAPSAELSLLFFFAGLALAAMYLGPAVAITHRLVPPGMRAMSSAVLFFIINMIGLGLGPTVVGISSDAIRASATALAGSFLGPTADLVTQDSLKWSMILAVVLMYPLSILWHTGARRLPKGELDDNGEAMGEAAAAAT